MGAHNILSRWLWKRRIARTLKDDKAWQYFVEGEWLCPFCGKIGVGKCSDNERPGAVLDHLADECGRFGQPDAESLTVKALDRIRETTAIAKNLTLDPRWKVTDIDGMWFCPFCCSATNVNLRDLSKSNLLAKAGQVCDHLDRCYSHRMRDGKPLPAEELKIAIARSNKDKKTSEQVKKKLSSDERWKLRIIGGVWLCPYCEDPIPGIDISSQILLEFTAPIKIARHLLYGCQAVKQGKRTIRTLENLMGRVEEINAERAEAATVEEPEMEQLLNEVSDLRSRLRETEDLADSMQKARDIQIGMLPKKLPDIPGYQFAVKYAASTQIGGDFYDFINVMPGKLGLAVGDVSGHGLNAALVMSMVKKTMAIRGRGVESAAAVLQMTNADVYPDLNVGTFVTIAYGVLNLETGQLMFSRAGHTPLLIYNPLRPEPVTIVNPGGMAVGMDSGPIFDRTLEEQVLELRSGDFLIQYTDGLTEAMNEKAEQFGMKRTRGEVLASSKAKTSEELLRCIMESVEKFTGGRPLDDDLTLLVVRRE